MSEVRHQVWHRRQNLELLVHDNRDDLLDELLVAAVRCLFFTQISDGADRRSVTVYIVIYLLLRDVELWVFGGVWSVGRHILRVFHLDIFVL